MKFTRQRQREKQRQVFRAMKWTLRGTEADFSISQVYETKNGQELLRTSKDEVEMAIIQANDTKYRQTNDTPAMSLLLPDLGFLGTSPACKDILQGTYIPCTP